MKALLFLSLAACVAPDATETSEISADPTSPWTDTVPFCFANDFQGDRCMVRQALATLSVDGSASMHVSTCSFASPARGITPLRFVEQTHCSDFAMGTAYLDYRSIDDNSHTDLDPGHPGVEISLHLGVANQSTVQHETAHALGFVHEIRRPDAEPDHILRHRECSDAGDGSWDHQTGEDPDARLLSDYDFSSIMQTDSQLSSRDGRHPFNPSRVNVDAATCGSDGGFHVFPHDNDLDANEVNLFNNCPATTRVDGANASAHYCARMADLSNRWLTGVVIDSDSQALKGWNATDVNGAYQLHEPLASSCIANQRLGSDLAIGDFDNDGYDDVAVGGKGVVELYKGTYNGLVRWRTLTKESLGLAIDASRFGESLVAHAIPGTSPGDSLLIGAPLASGGNVVVLTPTPAVAATSTVPPIKSSGLALAYTITSATVNASDADFGRVVKAGNLRNGSDVDLAISTSSNRVEVVKLGPVAWSAREVIPSTGAIDFGHALATGNFDSDSAGIEELAISAPNANGGAGEAWVARRTGGTWTLLLVAPDVSGANHFGAALAMGFHKLAVGSPDAAAANGSSGRVVEYIWSNGAPAKNQAHIPPTGGVYVSFGAALHYGNLDNDGNGNLLIGAPGSGEVRVVRASGSVTLASPNLLDSGFGSALASTGKHGFAMFAGAAAASCGSIAHGGGFATYPGTLMVKRQFRRDTASSLF